MNFPKRHRAQTERINALISIGEMDRAFQFIRCLRSVENERNLRIQGQYLSYSGFRCKNQFCAFCAYKRAMKKKKQYLHRFVKFAESGLKMHWDTYTIPNVDQLQFADYQSLFNIFKKLSRSRHISDYMIGALVRAETTYNADRKSYHPHLEAIVITDGGLRARGEEWERLTAGRAITRSVETNRGSKKAMQKQIANVISYVCKEIPLNLGSGFISVYYASKGKPLIRPYGSLRNRRSDIHDNRE